MAIVVGDIHGFVEKAQAFLNYRPEAEHMGHFGKTIRGAYLVAI